MEKKNIAHALGCCVILLRLAFIYNTTALS